MRKLGVRRLTMRKIVRTEKVIHTKHRQERLEGGVCEGQCARRGEGEHGGD